jgi:hypothetical protein
MTRGKEREERRGRGEGEVSEPQSEFSILTQKPVGDDFPYWFW